MVKGQGVEEGLINDMHRVSQLYFARPYWEKMQFKMPPDRYRGYTPYSAESLSRSLDEVAPPETKESFSIGPLDPDKDEYHFGNPPAERAAESKTSLLFFHQPSYDLVIECIPTCSSTDKPPKYDRITSGEHVTMKINKHRTVDEALVI